jgi:hypothetical protein
MDGHGSKKMADLVPKYPIDADINKKYQWSYGVLCRRGWNQVLRGTFDRIQKESVRHMSVNDDSVGRSVMRFWDWLRLYLHQHKCSSVGGNINRMIDPSKPSDYQPLSRIPVVHENKRVVVNRNLSNQDVGEIYTQKNCNKNLKKMDFTLALYWLADPGLLMIKFRQKRPSDGIRERGLLISLSWKRKLATGSGHFRPVDPKRFLFLLINDRGVADAKTRPK